ncbi:aminotransferase class V-fold PLP-dependent enzyme [Thalassobaculum litoreum]|uniref:Cysteine desulfurase n=1 Tax=Thalassobaculum litoreum DSM 18839 TaxID=1123362 RepID=A0A8G2BJ36_9PROT|nr:cysteine desulfurase [Thalassobaculum litoreum]SDG00783.1 cysteine desulfurase / selenocysteine lyase [Thalassobaculum litoreum DSM 18839]
MPEGATAKGEAYDIARIRADFPILSSTVHGKPLVYLDNGASAQKPRQVIDRISEVYSSGYANVHRGLHFMSEKATDDYEGARETVRGFLNAASTSEIIFTRNTTEAINLVASSWGRANLQPGDEILITYMEHHSNIVPWQMLRDEKGLVLKALKPGEGGAFDMAAFKELLTERTKLVAICHVSNVLGTVVPVHEVTKLAHDAGAAVLLDGSQAVQHIGVDVRDIGCDFYCFTGHKLYGPSGIGVLYGKESVLDAMPPYQGGGDMISSVSIEKSEWADLPAKFEAGTPAIAQAIGLAAAIDYVNGVGLDRIAEHERDLLNYATQKLASVEGLEILGTAAGKVSLVTFTLDCAHPHDIATIVDQQGVAVRAGHHCAQPLMDFYDVGSTTRASFAMYNTREEIDVLAGALDKVRQIFA